MLKILYNLIFWTTRLDIIWRFCVAMLCIFFVWVKVCNDEFVAFYRVFVGFSAFAKFQFFNWLLFNNKSDVYGKKLNEWKKSNQSRMKWNQPNQSKQSRMKSSPLNQSNQWRMKSNQPNQSRMKSNQSRMKSNQPNQSNQSRIKTFIIKYGNQTRANFLKAKYRWYIDLHLNIF